MEKRNSAVDVVRCLMAVLIMLYHYTYRYFEMFSNTNNQYQSQLKYGGTVGVAVFFIISAFYSMKSDYSNVKKAILKKIIRLYPAYVCAVIISFTVNSIYKVSILKVSIVDFILNLTMLARYVGANMVDGAHWYVYFLMVFYCWHIIISNKKVKTKYWPYIIWLIISSVTSGTFMKSIGLKKVFLLNSKLEALCTVVFLERYVSYIIVGIMIYFICNNIGNNVCSISLAIIALIRNCAYVPIEIILLIGIMGVVLYFMFANIIVIPTSKFIYYCASLSYPVYLVHQDIGYILFQQFSLECWMQWIMIVSIAIILSIVIALAIYYIDILVHPVLEKASIQLIDNRIIKRKS